MTAPTPPATASGWTVSLISSDDARGMLPELGRIYGEAFADPPYSRSRGQADHFAQQILPGHLDREDTRIARAVDDDGRTVGFCYGYQGAPGQYWTEYVRGILGSALSREWALGTHFEIAELAVGKAWRGRGIGRALITAVMDAAPAGSTFLLGTNEHADPALGLYHSLGYTDIRGNAGYVVLGRRP